MSEREYNYFIDIDKKCKDYRSSELKYNSSKDERSQKEIKARIDELSSLPNEKEALKILGITLLIVFVYVLFIRDPDADVGVGGGVYDD